MNTARRSYGNWFATAAFASVLTMMPTTARALPGGTIAITESAEDPKSPTFEKDLKKHTKHALAKQGEAWHVFFVAYLKKAAGAPEVNVVFYETLKGKREQINAYPIGTQDTAKIIMSDLSVSEDQGFKPGHKYEVLIARIVNDKEDVYAKTMLELK